jgi:uncharacterized protein
VTAGRPADIPGGDGLVPRVIRFSSYLKRHGFKVFPSSVQEALLAFEALGPADPHGLYLALRANMVHSDLEWGLFDELYREFWLEAPAEDARGGRPRREEAEPPFNEDAVRESVREEAASVDDRRDDPGEEKEELEGAVYSPVPSFERRAFDRIAPEDIRFARLALRNMITQFRFAASRRKKASRRSGDMDFRRTFRESLKSGGLPLRLHHKKKRKRRRKLLVLADVSGSMDRHARFVMPFLLGIKAGGVKAEVFVFSTSLSHISPLLKKYSVEEALDRLCDVTPDWSGGTRIGHSLRQFNREHGDRLLTRKTVVVILSDGWDLGARKILRTEMAVIREKARRVLWLNPLAGDPDVQSLCGGMRAALPYIHHVLPADSLRSLMRAGHVLASALREH